MNSAICNVPFRWLVRNYGAAVRTSKLGAIPKISWRSSSTETIPIIPDHTLAVSSRIMHLVCSTFGPCLSKNNYTISISFDLLYFPIILLSRDTNVHRTRLSACKRMPDCFILMRSELKKKKKRKRKKYRKKKSQNADTDLRVAIQILIFRKLYLEIISRVERWIGRSNSCRIQNIFVDGR